MSPEQYAFASTLALAVAVGTSFRRVEEAHNTDPDMFYIDVFFDFQTSIMKLLVFLNFLCVCTFAALQGLVALFLQRLRVEETRALKERAVNYLLFKVVFVAAVLPQSSEWVLWATWFTVVGLMNLVAFLCRHRFEYYSWTPVARSQHIQLMTLLGLVLAADLLNLAGCVYLFKDLGMSTLMLLLVDCATIALSTCQTIIKYVIHLWDLHCDGVWESRSSAVFYTEFAFDTASLAVTLAHYIHIWMLNGITFQIIDAVLFLNTRSVFTSLKQKMRSYRNFLQVARDMNLHLPDATEEQVKANDDACAICQQEMRTAKLLPCGHMFHRMCLRQWLQRLESNGKCPICRRSVLAGAEGQPSPAPAPATPAPAAAAADPPVGAAGGAPQPQVAPLAGVVGNDFAAERPLFRLSNSGTGLGSWLPHFTLQLSTGGSVGGARTGGTAATSAHLAGLVANVLNVMPHLSPAAVQADLQRTRSAEATIERALSGLIPSATPQELAAAAAAAASAAAAAPPAATAPPEPAAAPPVAAPPPRVPTTPAAVVVPPAPAVPAAAPPVAAAGAGSSAKPVVDYVEGDSTDSDTIMEEVRSISKRDRFAVFQARKRAMIRKARRDYRRKQRAQT